MSCFILPFWTLCCFNIVSLQCLISRKNKHVRLFNRLWELTKRSLVLRIYVLTMHVILMHCTYIHLTQGREILLVCLYLTCHQLEYMYFIEYLLYTKCLAKHLTNIILFLIMITVRSGYYKYFADMRTEIQRIDHFLMVIANNGGVWIRIQVYLIIKLLLFYSSLMFWSHMEFLCCSVCTQSCCFIFTSWLGLK